MAVHPGHRQTLRPESELVGGQPPRRGAVHASSAGLPPEHLPDERGRLVPGTGLVQLGRRRRAQGRARQPGCRQAGRLCAPAHAQRDPQLRAQAAGAQAHRAQCPPAGPAAARPARPALLRHRREDPTHRPQAGSPVRRHDRGRVPGAEPGPQSARHLCQPQQHPQDPGRSHRALQGSHGRARCPEAALRLLAAAHAATR